MFSVAAEVVLAPLQSIRAIIRAPDESEGFRWEEEDVLRCEACGACAASEA